MVSWFRGLSRADKLLVGVVGILVINVALASLAGLLALLGDPMLLAAVGRSAVMTGPILGVAAALLPVAELFDRRRAA